MLQTTDSCACPDAGFADAGFDERLFMPLLWLDEFPDRSLLLRFALPVRTVERRPRSARVDRWPKVRVLPCPCQTIVWFFRFACDHDKNGNTMAEPELELPFQKRFEQGDSDPGAKRFVPGSVRSCLRFDSEPACIRTRVWIPGRGARQGCLVARGRFS